MTTLEIAFSVIQILVGLVITLTLLKMKEERADRKEGVKSVNTRVEKLEDKQQKDIDKLRYEQKEDREALHNSIRTVGKDLTEKLDGNQQAIMEALNKSNTASQEFRVEVIKELAERQKKEDCKFAEMGYH